MNPVVEQIVNIYKGMPLSRKILMGVVLLLVVAGFSTMFVMANKVEYQTLYTNLTAEDASQIVEKLKEQNVPYRLEAGGAAITVPSGSVYDVRLGLAGSGLPKGGGVGFEIFDKTDFGATEFVQNLNYQRALQGELSRTIKDFNEVLEARVMIVMAKDSVFVEEKKPPSASVMLKLKRDLSKEKIDAVVYLVASSVEDLNPEQVTVVDTTGRVLFKDRPQEDLMESTLANRQLQHKKRFEDALTERIQTMLERIVGKDKAIVRVTSDMSFDRTDISEETFDPDIQVVRSRHNIGENSETQTGPVGMISSVNPVVPPGEDGGPTETVERIQKNNDTVNYEIAKTITRTIKPIGELSRLSVAAVLDGKYTMEVDETGRKVRTFQPRPQEEMDQFTKIVQNAMGFSADRGDQVSVESFPFSSVDDEDLAPEGFDIARIRKEYGTIIANVLLVLAIFLFIVRPIVKTVKEVQATVEEPALPPPDEEQLLLDADGQPILPEPEEISLEDQALALVNQDMDKTANIIRGWISEG